jgi:hypothetical protein
MNANGDNAPKHLDRAFAMMQRETHKLHHQRRKGRIALPPGVETDRLPRALCPVCSQVFDFAVVPSDTLPTHRLCSACKDLLRDGFTIFVCAGRTPLAVRSEVLKAEGLAGKITTVSAEDYDRLAANQKTTDGLSEEKSA